MAMQIEKIIDARASEIGGREAHPINGWPLVFLARLDREGARGLVADMMMAGSLSRQAAFIVAACLDQGEQADFLKRLGIPETGAEGVGIALRQRRARDLIAATFRIELGKVPTGFLRALARIEEQGAVKPGLDALAEPGSYAALFRIFTSEHNDREAHALRYCGRLRSSSIEAVETLNPLLVWPEIVRAVGSPKKVTAANALLDLIRSSVSTATDEDMVLAMRRSLTSRNALETFACNALEKADRLPAPPFPASDGLRPLTSAADLQAFGRALENCAATKLNEIALGLLSIYEVKHQSEDGTDHVLAVSLTPLVNGTWMVSDLKGSKNRQPPANVQRAVLLRFQSLGAVISGPSLDSRYRGDLAELLGTYRWGAIDDCLRDEADILEELEAALDEVA